MRYVDRFGGGGLGVGWVGDLVVGWLVGWLVGCRYPLFSHDCGSGKLAPLRKESTVGREAFFRFHDYGWLRYLKFGNYTEHQRLESENGPPGRWRFQNEKHQIFRLVLC